MATDKYLYGSYGFVENSIVPGAEKSPVTIVYIGTAPVHLQRDYGKLVNTPILIDDYVDAQNKIGYSKDWNAFTIMEAVEAHFNNPLGNIGPIIVVNVLDPKVHAKSDAQSTTLTFVDGKAEIKSTDIILDSLALENLIEGVDYEVSYDFGSAKAIIRDLNDTINDVSASYKEIDPSLVTPEDVIGIQNIDGECKGIGSVKLVYPEYNKVPSIILAPGFSHHPKVYKALVAVREKINDRWDGYILGDIPLVDSENNTIDTLTNAIDWKKKNGYNSGYSTVCWPMGLDVESNKLYHMSTLTGWAMMITDTANGGIPMETPGNTELPVDRLYYGENNINKGYDRSEANMITQKGITTGLFWGGSYHLWGDHTAAYEFEPDTDKLDLMFMFDVNIRMLMYVANSFQEEWNSVVDEPMSHSLKDTILNKEQEKLDILVNMGALLGEPKVDFIKKENIGNNIVQGRFRFDFKVTSTPPAKALSAYVTYSDEGLNTFYGEEE